MNERKTYTILDYYKYYHCKHPLGLDYRRFKALLADYYTILRDRLLNGSEELEMPYKLGTIRIVKYRHKSHNVNYLSVDFQACAKYGKKIYHLNNHSDGYQYRLIWNKIYFQNPSVYFYLVCLTRANKRGLALIIKNNINDFPEI